MLCYEFFQILYLQIYLLAGMKFFSDEAYKNAGLEIAEDVSDCDVLLGVKEVPIDALIPNKKYFFFSHTIKKQPYNRKLIQAILKKNIELFDHETIITVSYTHLTLPTTPYV